VIERIHPEQDGPEGLMLDIANAHDDTFRWRVAAAVVQVATIRLEKDVNDAFAKKAIYQWTEVGEVFARYLAVGRGMPPNGTDEEIKEAVRRSWDTLEGVPDAES
jgi:hypothetical protein